MRGREVSRSRSPRLEAPSEEVRENWLREFARIYWAPADAPDVPPWTGRRALQVARFRERVVTQAELAAPGAQAEGDELQAAREQLVTKETVMRWQRFTFFEDIGRMSDVLFRGPIETVHADDIDFRLHTAWRRLSLTIADFGEFSSAVVDFRLSAVRVAMMLETSRPADACDMDGEMELPDARTLAGLLSLRCEKDDPAELIEMYRLICQKLEGVRCAWCDEALDECSSAGVFDGSEALVIPATIPKLLVPQCGHAIHTTCFGSQLIPDRSSEIRGCCRICRLPYAWTSIDVDPMVSAFCLLFGPYVDKRACAMRAEGEISPQTILSIAEVCLAFSEEMDGLISPVSTWVLLTKRHSFTDSETIDVMSEFVIKRLQPQFDEPNPQAGTPLTEHLADSADERLSEDEHVTEVFLPEVLDPSPCERALGQHEPEPEPAESECGLPDMDADLPPMPDDSLLDHGVG